MKHARVQSLYVHIQKLRMCFYLFALLLFGFRLVILLLGVLDIVHSNGKFYLHAYLGLPDDWPWFYFESMMVVDV